MILLVEQGDSLVKNDKEQFQIGTTKGRYLFLQKMIDSTVSGGEILLFVQLIL